MFGTLGYSMSSLSIGFLLKVNPVFIFALSTLFLTANAFFIRKLNTIEIIRETQSKVETTRSGSWKLFLFYLSIGAASIILISFNGTFLPQFIGLRQFDPSLAGICFAVLSFSEVPFLLFAKKILKHLGTFLLLSSGILLISIRMFITPFAHSELALLLIQVIHGWNYIVVYYSIFDYIHYELPQQYATKAQSLFWMAIQGFSFFIGSSFGGLLVQNFGVEPAYRILSIGLSAIAIPLFVAAVYLRVRKKTPQPFGKRKEEQP
jgi:PPP family 3-phenylpropionic acid transporter